MVQIRKNTLLSSPSLPVLPINVLFYFRRGNHHKIRMNRFSTYVPGQHQKVVCRAAGIAIQAAQQGHEDHAPGWMQAPVTAGQRRELPVAASSCQQPALV